MSRMAQEDRAPGEELSAIAANEFVRHGARQHCAMVAWGEEGQCPFQRLGKPVNPIALLESPTLSCIQRAIS